ncbi:hypothetical protein AB0K68_51270, partial [Streptomyces sp. NPDC050698]
MNTKKPGAKGGEFEERLRSYFAHAGFLAIRSVPFFFEGDEVSDVDVWLYERPNAIARRRTIVDAKNKQRPKAVERILWVKGFQIGLKIDGAIVATTDRRPGIKKFASSLGISVLDGDALERLIAAQRLEDEGRLSHEDLFDTFSRADSERSNREWAERLAHGKSSLLSNFGFLSANYNLENARFFAEAGASPNRERARAAARAFLLSCCFAAASLDFAAKDLGFRSVEERRENLILGLRFGETGGVSTLEMVNLALGLVRQYAENGTAISKQVETRFLRDAARIRVEIVAEYVSKIINRENLFQISRELDRYAFDSAIPQYDDFSIDLKSFLSVVLDSFEINRKILNQLFPATPA